MGLASSLLLFEFGSGRALVRYVAEFRVDGEEEKYGLALKTCWLITTATSLLVGAIFIGVAFARDVIFNIPPELMDEAFWLLIGAGGYSFLLLIAQISQSMLKGSGIFLKRNLLAVWQLIFQAVLIALVWLFGLSIHGLMIGMTLILLLSVLLDLRVLLRDAADLLRFDLAVTVPSRSVVGGEVWEYAKGTFNLSIVGFFSQNVDQLVIAFFLDVRFVTIYAIITKPYNVLKSLLSKGYIILHPHYVRIDASHGRGVLGLFVKKGGRLISLIMALLISPAIILLPTLIEFWVRTPKYNEFVIYGQILLGAIVVKSLTTMTNQSLYLIGETKALFRIESVVVAINFLVSLLLVNFIGIGGVIIGTCLQVLLSVPLLMNLSKAKLSVPSVKTDINGYRYFAWACLYLFTIIFLSVVLENNYRETTFEKVILLSLIYGLVLGVSYLGFNAYIKKSGSVIQEIFKGRFANEKNK